MGTEPGPQRQVRLPHRQRRPQRALCRRRAGERIYNAYEHIYLVQTLAGHYLLQTLNNVFFYFGEIQDDNTSIPLQRLAVTDALNQTPTAGARLRFCCVRRTDCLPAVRTPRANASVTTKQTGCSASTASLQAFARSSVLLKRRSTSATTRWVP